MVLDLQILNEDAVLNNFMSIGGQRYLPGQALKLVVRLIQSDRDLRYIPLISATTSLTLYKSDASTVVKAGVFSIADDRSIITFDFSAAEMVNVIGQNLTVEITEGAVITAAFLKGGLQSAAIDC